MPEWSVNAFRGLAGVAAVALFLLLPESAAWQAAGGFLYGLLIQLGFSGAEDAYWLTHSGASRRERLLARGAVIFAAWLGAWLFWPGLDVVMGMERLPGAAFVVASFLGAIVYFYGATAMPQEGD